MSGAGQIALTGIIAGPTARWGQVREAMRHADIGRLTQLVPDAWRRSFDDIHGVTLNDSDTVHAALFITPDQNGLSLSAFTVDHLGEIAQHGVAWLSGDFRTGPHIDLGHHEAAVIHSVEREIALLVDGESTRAAPPLRFERTWSALKFLTTDPRAD